MGGNQGSYKYGLLGQVEEETRVIKLLPISSGKTKAASMKYESNYLGQMEKIEYPDGEAVRYTYNAGGQIAKVTGNRKGTEFPYVKNIGYDEFGQRAYIEYGSGVKTRYGYDPYRRWLSSIRTESPEMGHPFQDMRYTFDAVGNVLGYENTAYGHTTTQNYAYDGLYQLIEAKGASRSHPYGSGTEYVTDYQQDFSFNKIGNMTKKASKEYVSNTNRIGVNLNYNLDYSYYAGTHMAERIGSRYYDYDRNGNLVAEREGGHAVTPEVYRPYYQDGDLYYTDYGFGLVKPNAAPPDDGVYQRNYRWNERNLLSESSDSVYTVQYRYGADGQRALKFTANSGRSTAYFNKMWQTSDAAGGWLQSKHIYVNEDRITTKYNSEGNDNTAAEKERTYYYHSDHLGSAQTVTNYKGQVHERLEYTPYGELWIDWRSDLAPEDSTPFRFTGKEQDAETGLYYYGARYLNPKTGRWLSGDPAMGEYLPVAPVSDEAKKHNGNLPGQGGVFNYVNLHAYHYAGNNPVKYVDPNGEIDVISWFIPDADKMTRQKARDWITKYVIKNIFVPITQLIFQKAMDGDTSDFEFGKDSDISDLMSRERNKANNLILDQLRKGFTEGSDSTKWDCFDLTFSINDCDFSWKLDSYDAKTNIATVTVQVSDTFDFNEKKPGERPPYAEKLTAIGKKAGLAEFKVKITYELKITIDMP